MEEFFSQKESVFWVLLLFLRPFSVCFSSFWNKSVCFGCFKMHPKHQNKPKQNFYWFRKWTETNAKQILFRLFSVRTENYFYLFRGHPTVGTQRCHFEGVKNVPIKKSESSIQLFWIVPDFFKEECRCTYASGRLSYNRKDRIGLSYNSISVLSTHIDWIRVFA